MGNPVPRDPNNSVNSVRQCGTTCTRICKNIINPAENNFVNNDIFIVFFKENIPFLTKVYTMFT